MQTGPAEQHNVKVYCCRQAEYYSTVATVQTEPACVHKNCSRRCKHHTLVSINTCTDAGRQSITVATVQTGPACVHKNCSRRCKHNAWVSINTCKCIRSSLQFYAVFHQLCLLVFKLHSQLTVLFSGFQSNPSMICFQQCHVNKQSALGEFVFTGLRIAGNNHWDDAITVDKKLWLKKWSFKILIYHIIRMCMVLFNAWFFNVIEKISMIDIPTQTDTLTHKTNCLCLWSSAHWGIRCKMTAWSNLCMHGMEEWVTENCILAVS